MIDKLRNGNVVEFRNGERAIVLDEDFLVIQDGRAFFLPTDYNKDSGESKINVNLDIVKIYDRDILKLVGTKNALSSDYEPSLLVWEPPKITPNLSSVLSQFDIVEYQNGKRAMLIGDNFISETGYMEKDAYTENGTLKHSVNCASVSYNIVRVFRPNNLNTLKIGFNRIFQDSNLYFCNCELIWENI